MEPNPDRIRELLGLTHILGVQFYFFPLLGRVNVVIPEGVPRPDRKTHHQANRECGWDIDLYSSGEYERHLHHALPTILAVPNVSARLAQDLVALGYMTLDDLCVIDSEDLATVGGFSIAEAEEMIHEVDRICLEQQ